jgi:hypothetical protein
MIVEVKYSIELLKGQSEAIPNFVIRNSVFDIRYLLSAIFIGSANKNRVRIRPDQDVTI